LLKSCQLFLLTGIIFTHVTDHPILNMTPESNSPPPNHVPNRNRFKLLLKHFLLSLASLSLSFCLLLAWLISTEGGLRLLVTQAQQWAPGELKIQSSQGRLLDQFSFTGLSYQYQDFALQIASFQLAWEAPALWNTKVHLTQWHVNQVEIHLPTSKATAPDEKSTSLELPSLQLPVQIALDDVQIRPNSD
jgi:translocation and assembly module TamB